MSDYSRYESGKFGPRIYNKGSFRVFAKQQFVQQSQKKERPILINPETKTWMVWDDNIQDYTDSKISILKDNKEKNE